MATYGELLNTIEWQERCFNILTRDNGKCQKCGKIGFHRNLVLQFNTAEELDKYFGLSNIDVTTISSFIMQEYDNSNQWKKSDECSISQKEYIAGGYSSYKIETHLFNPICNFGRIVTKKEFRLFDFQHAKDTFYTLSYKYYGSENFSFSEGLNTHAIYGVALKFKEDLSNSFLVAIYNLFPSGIINDGFSSYLTSDIIISIVYKKISITLYLLPSFAESGLPYAKEHEIQAKGLNIHHKYYIIGKKPWEYDDDALITLCEDCHEKIHKSSNTPIYNHSCNPQNLISNAKTCDRCNGSGYIPRYMHVDDGICFKCWGEGAIIE